MRSLRGHYAVTTRSLRGHYAVTTRSLRGHSWLLRSFLSRNAVANELEIASKLNDGGTSSSFLVAKCSRNRANNRFEVIRRETSSSFSLQNAVETGLKIALSFALRNVFELIFVAKCITDLIQHRLNNASTLMK